MTEGEAGFHNDEHTWQSGLNNGKLEPETPAAQPQKCPHCGSQQAWRDGLRYNKHSPEPVQRWRCKKCDMRLSASNWNGFKDSEPAQRIQTKSFYSHQTLPSTRQVCVSQTKAMINLAKVETRTQKKAAGATETQPTSTDIKSPLFQFAWWLKKEGYAETTIISRVKLLKILAKRGADIHNPDSIKEVIARQEWSNKRRLNAADAYTSFLKMTGGTWTPPRYRVEQKLPFIPTEAELDALIAGCGPKTSTFIKLLKETGMRAGEAHRLQWIDIDFERGTVRVTPEKGSKPRLFKLSPKLLSMLQALSVRGNPQRIFSKQLKTQRRLFQKQRATLARKLQNPRLLQIHFHTFRHWKATMEYHKTRDILHVMNILGHRSIQNTLVYTQLVNFEDDEYSVRVAHSLEEDKQLIEAGFEYITERDNFKIYRKRK